MIMINISIFMRKLLRNAKLNLKFKNLSEKSVSIIGDICHYTENP